MTKSGSNQNESKKVDQPLDSVGTRRYARHLGDAVTSGDLEAAADEAQKAALAQESHDHGSRVANAGRKGAMPAANQDAVRK
jgi:hypothetical protein